MTKQCLQCGKVYGNKDVSHPERFSKRKFCSSKCYGLNRRHTKMRETPCKTCGGTTFYEVFRGRQGGVKQTKGREFACLDCKNRINREYRNRNLARVKKRKQERRRPLLLKKYGLTEEGFYQMKDEQKGVCAICQTKESLIHQATGKPRELAIDHCHETNRIRGLLCATCNLGLGYFSHDERKLLAAANYLRRAQG